MKVGGTPAPPLGHQRSQPQRLTSPQRQLRLGLCDAREQFGTRLRLLVATTLPPGSGILSGRRWEGGFFVPLIYGVIAVWAGVQATGAQ